MQCARRVSAADVVQVVDRLDVGGQIPVVDADGAILDGLWAPPADAASHMSYALEPGRQRQVKQTGLHQQVETVAV